LPGIAELIEDGRTGVLVPPGDPRALAAALEALIRDPGRRTRLGNAGEARVRHEFAMDGGIAVLAGLFGLREQQPAPARISAAAAD
jgi:glycosyltransferase involved in cell wall biosynthesis